MCEEYFSVAEIARREQVSTKTVYEWIKKGLNTKQEHVAGLKYRQVVMESDLDNFLGRG